MQQKIFVVSCQALEDEPLYGSGMMLKMAKAALIAGADWIRTSQLNNIQDMVQNLTVPIIGLIKRKYPKSEVFITPTIKELKDLIQTGVHIIALDATLRSRPQESLVELVQYFHKHKQDHQKLLADCSDLESIQNAVKLKFDFIATTLAGYTKKTQGKYTSYNDFEILKEAKKFTHHISLVAEGQIDTPQKARQAFLSGADIVVVGSAITRPRTIVTKFINEIRRK